ncbi:DUF418 domain-containing protein [Tunicatimonas pelagia]|uniref:DUF418 domain-containing protein n=1 Tax=Tunicatimonas pelagia TaxID=931531 RepID=UPI002665C12C|nr:DUF418 domain-containing protein [Tunicatimonas pelagia]WKN43128.1 DUF418 domain-containing protein [Tunicatimonas pelagia]
MPHLNYQPKASGRIEVVDALRGFALFAVLFTHFTTAFSGYPSFLTDTQIASLPFPELNQLVFKLNLLLFKLKSRVLFSFLFGLGFYFQIRKAERLGISFRQTFVKRLFVMLIIGLIHAYLIQWGDILRWYFVAGVFLLFLYRLNNYVILAIAFTLAFIVPASESILEMTIPHTSPSGISKSQIQQAFLSGSYWETVIMNVLMENQHYVDPWYFVGYVSNILGFFFLGLWAGKIDLFKRATEYLPEIRQAFIISIPVLLFGSLVFIHSPLPREEFPVMYQILHSVGYRMNTVGLFTFYLCGFILLFRQPTVRHYLETLVPVGKMTLTNYILQSIVAVLLFNGLGFGLLGQIGPALILPIIVLFFAFQMAFSTLWLRFFHVGPLEWVWRIAVSGKWQPLLKEKHPVA